MSSNSVIKDILHYQKKIQKSLSDDGSDDPKELLRYLGKLAKLAIGVEHLQETGIGRTINAMRKKDGAVGEEARALVNKWKDIVAKEDENDSNHQEEAGEEANNNSEEEPDSDVSSDHKLKTSSRKGKQSKHSKGDSSCDDTPSTSKTKSKSSDKHKATEKHNKDLKIKEESSKSKSKSSRKRRRSDSASQTDEQDGDDATSRSFADALGSIESVSKKKKSKDKEKHREEKKKKVMPAQVAPTSTLHSVPLVSKPLDIRPTDFEISPYYKPLPLKFTDTPSTLVREKTRTAEEALSVAMAQKGSRTKVFSGNRVSGPSSVPRLFDSCIRVLQMNIEYLDVIGGIPYDIILPVLERANPQQLYKLEHYNPYLLDDTDELWRRHCEKEFKKYPLEEMETWRDKYLRCVEVREAKLKSLTMSHKQSAAKATPVRTTKLAYVESVTKNPRGQTKQGASAVLVSMTNAKAGARPFEAAHQSTNGAAAVAEVVKMAAPSGRSSSSASSNGSSAAAAAANKKPKVAPLMQKTLKLMKNRFRR